MSYLQLAHNEWNPAAKTSRAKVLYSSAAGISSTGRDRALIAALTRVVDMEAVPAVQSSKLAVTGPWTG